MWVVVAVVVLVVAVATYLTWVATRVDRLHARAEDARAALDTQSVRRAGAAIELGEQERLDDARDAGRAVLAASQGTGAAGGYLPGGPMLARVEAENRLTRELRLAASKFDARVLADLAETSRRLALARQLHSDLVRDALALRRRPLVRLLRLARRHPAPEFFDIDDPALDPPAR
ncbi:MAG TPA: hypothetical protein VH561_09660 [Micromonosporaceae bacterium]